MLTDPELEQLFKRELERNGNPPATFVVLANFIQVTLAGRP